LSGIIFLSLNSIRLFNRKGKNQVHEVHMFNVLTNTVEKLDILIHTKGRGVLVFFFLGNVKIFS
jgi:glutamine synthetase type III